MTPTQIAPSYLATPQPGMQNTSHNDNSYFFHPPSWTIPNPSIFLLPSYLLKCPLSLKQPTLTIPTCLPFHWANVYPLLNTEFRRHCWGFTSTPKSFFASASVLTSYLTCALSYIVLGYFDCWRFSINVDAG